MESLLAIAHTAILALRQGVQWKPGKAEPHLQKRISRGHLPQGATQADYDAIIQAVAHDPTATVYVYTRRTNSASSSAGGVSNITANSAVNYCHVS